MPRRTRLCAVLLLGLCLVPLGGAGAQTVAQGQMLARALDQARAGDWNEAAALGRQAGGQVGSDIILWLRLRDGGGNWAEYQSFLARAGDWPSLDALRRGAERAMPEGLPPAEVIGFFATEPPRSGTGSLRLANALAEVGRRPEAEAEISRGWTTMSLSGREQGAIAADWGDTVTPLNSRRLDMLLWRGLTSEAENMLPLVDADWQALGRARIGVRRDADGTTALIDALPKQVRSDPGLGFERYLYRVRTGRWDEAAQYMLKYSTSAATLGRPEMWMERRANLAREALQRGDVATAYKLASQGHGTEGADYADAEWMAGYIALTRMDDAARAVGHFQRFGTLVFTPISLGRAGYWLGLAQERAGDTAAAQLSFRAAAALQTSFYGQLAAERAGIGFDRRIAGEDPASDWRAAPVIGSSVAQAGILFAQAGDDSRASQFLRAAAQGQLAAARAALAQMAIDLGRPHIGIRIAKDAAADGIVLPRQYYPLNAIARARWPVPTELALAIARQESEMNPGVSSDAGARGLMQLMPATARHVAGTEGVTYAVGRLSDPMYNARLGTAYLAEMLGRFRGSYVLAVASYNAGPGRVSQWIGDFGDPRYPGVDTVNWIESIPFDETRNYVMRVLEGMQVYRVRLRGAPVPMQLAADMNNTG